MCGILFHSSNNKINKSTFKNSLDSIIHRGPDDSGIENINFVSLGSCRLAIQDLTKNGHMPMCDKSKRYWIVFNGEIYNFKEIKKDLSEFNFISNSDTEVILYSYIKWGTKCLEKFRGMFAFLIYDSKENTVFFSRDRFGQRPLLYYYDNEELIIGSEVKAILKIKPSLAEFDTTQLSNLLSFRYIPDNKTGFKKINMLPAGSYVKLKLGSNFEIQKYWYPENITDNNLNLEEILNKTENLLIDAIKYRLIADVPVGIFLSGGLDSSLITAIASKYYPSKLQTFSVGYQKKDVETELDYAKIVSNKYKTKHTEVYLDFNKLNLQNEIEDLFKVLDRPIADPAILPSFIMSKQVSKHLKVVLNGDGGDELFAGYGWYKDIFKIRDYMFMPQALRNLIYELAKNFNSRAGFLTEGLSKSFEEALLYKIGCFHPEISNKYYIDKKSILKPEFYTDSSSILRVLFSKTDNMHKKALFYDIFQYMPNDTLPKIDFATLGNSLESRSPFLDHLLAEFAFSIPFKYKLFNGEYKYITKKIAEKYLPNEIIYRKKQGFSVPLERWFREDLNNYIKDTLLSNNSFVSNYLNINVIKDLIKEHENGADYSNHLWILLTLEKWGNNYIKL